MNPEELLTELSQRGVILSAVDDKLRIDAPKGVLTSELRQVLTEQKTAILGLLRGVSQNETQTTDPTDASVGVASVRCVDTTPSSSNFPDVPKSVVKTIEELTETERAEFDGMNIDPADVDSILATPHGLVVNTGRKRWMEARLGKQPLSDVEMARMKRSYNKILSDLRILEKDMTSADLPKHKALMDKLSMIHEVIVLGGYEVTPEETRQGFDVPVVEGTTDQETHATKKNIVAAPAVQEVDQREKGLDELIDQLRPLNRCWKIQWARGKKMPMKALLHAATLWLSDDPDDWSAANETIFQFTSPFGNKQLCYRRSEKIAIPELASSKRK